MKKKPGKFWQALSFSNQNEKPLFKKINAELERQEKGYRPPAESPVEALARQYERESGKSYHQCHFWAVAELKKREAA